MEVLYKCFYLQIYEFFHFFLRINNLIRSKDNSVRTSILRFERLVNSVGCKTISYYICPTKLFERLVNSVGCKT